MPHSAERRHHIETFLATTTFSGATLAPLAGDASFRRYVRVRKDGNTAMLMDAPPGKEDVRPFLAVATHLVSAGYSAPTILAADINAGLLLLEDLGDDSFTRLLKEGRASETELYEAAIDVLAEWHGVKAPLFGNAALALPAYDEALLMREVRLFADWYLPQALGKDNAIALGQEYMALWREILASAPLATNCFVHRDYHADNLMWLPGRDGTRRVGLLDFQDGVYGDAAYDLVSLLEDARRDVPPVLAAQLIERYLSATGTGRERFHTAYAMLGAQRNSKIIGIFSRLAARDGKHHYLQYLPRVWKHLAQDVHHPALATLAAWLDRHIDASARGVIAIRHDARELALTA